MLRDNNRHRLEAFFQVIGVVVNYRKGQKELNKIVLHSKSTLARPPIYKRVYSEMLSAASPGNLVSITKSFLLLSFVKQDEKSLEESTNPKRT